ncbi:transposase [Streptomyces sp. NPDC004629]|uniref:transposase n=1 Tax=Streptomyces sp. NPDC004629 TaxID=3364705 RepID=UPI0036B94AB9
MVFDRKYSDEVRQRAVERVLQRRRAEPENRSIVREVAEEFEVGPQSLRKWLTRYDDGSYDYDSPDGHGDGWEPGTPPPAARQQRRPSQRELQARIEELERRIAVLQEDNRSLTRVVSLLADQLRVATTTGVQTPDSAIGHPPRV